jgi:hypothetical protein
VEISDGAVIKCNYELCAKVVSKSNIQPKPPSRVTHTRASTYSVRLSVTPNLIIVLDVVSDIIIYNIIFMYYGIRKGADKFLAFPICSTTKRIFLGWVKEFRTTKS